MGNSRHDLDFWLCLYIYPESWSLISLTETGGRVDASHVDQPRTIASASWTSILCIFLWRHHQYRALRDLMHANVSVLPKVYCDEAAYLRSGQILLLRPVSSAFSVLVHRFTCPCSSYRNDSTRMKSFVRQVINRSSILNNVPSVPGSCFMVNPTLSRLVKSLTLCRRAFDTIREALTVSGGLFLDQECACISLILCLT